MGVLPAILPHSWRITFDVTRVEPRLIEGRIKELNEIGTAADEALVDSAHGLAGPVRVAGTPDHGPALGQGIDLALRIGARAKWIAVVEIGTEIPIPVPSVLFDVLLELSGLDKATIGKSGIIALACPLRKSR